MKKIIITALFATVFFSCLKKSDSTSCNFDACAVVAPQAEIQAVENYLSAKGITAAKHCSGLYYRIDNQGTGATPTVCNNVDVTYEGKLTNGTTFDQTTTAVTFYLGQLIRAWQIGIPLIKAGGRIYLYVPPALAYGNQQVGTIPPNSVLIFQVDLVGVH